MVTQSEQKLITKLNKQGFLKLEDFQAAFSVNYWKGMVHKFLAMGIMKETDVVGKFVKR